MARGKALYQGKLVYEDVAVMDTDVVSVYDNGVKIAEMINGTVVWFLNPDLARSCGLLQAIH